MQGAPVQKSQNLCHLQLVLQMRHAKLFAAHYEITLPIDTAYSAGFRLERRGTELRDDSRQPGATHQHSRYGRRQRKERRRRYDI